MTMTNSEKQAAFRERMQRAGMVRVQGWVHRSQRERALKYLGRLGNGTQKIG